MPQGHPPAIHPPLAHAPAGRTDQLRRLPQSARLVDRSPAQDQHGQRNLLSVPCREARTLPVRASAGARELPELPPPAWLESVDAAGRTGPILVPAMPPEDRP